MKRLLVPEGKLRDAMELYPGKTREEVRKLLYSEVKKKLVPGIAASLFFLVLAVFAGKKPPEKGSDGSGDEKSLFLFRERFVRSGVCFQIVRDFFVKHFAPDEYFHPGVQAVAFDGQQRRSFRFCSLVKF